jgi:hypothetical protein
MKRYRLLAKAQIDGEVRPAGYVFTPADGERGPHKTMVASNADGMAWRHSKELTPADAGWPAGWIMPHVARAVAPQMLGLPGGMGHHPVSQTARSGVRKLGTGNSASTPDAMGVGFTSKIHPLEVIGGGGRR